MKVVDIDYNDGYSLSWADCKNNVSDTIKLLNDLQFIPSIGDTIGVELEPDGDSEFFAIVERLIVKDGIVLFVIDNHLYGRE